MSHYQRKDAVYRAARQAGLRSRAGVKLEDLDERFHLFSPGQRVVDLGCWPGAWLQVAARKVGAGGRIVGIDLVETRNFGAHNVEILVGDVTDARVRGELRRAMGGHADVVLSDMAPKLTGIRATDQARAQTLAETAVDVAREMLVPEGRLLVKLFSGVEAPVTGLLRKEFRTVTAFRPPSTRKGSSEIYVFAQGRRSSAALEAAEGRATH